MFLTTIEPCHTTYQQDPRIDGSVPFHGPFPELTFQSIVSPEVRKKIDIFVIPLIFLFVYIYIYIYVYIFVYYTNIQIYKYMYI